LSALLKRRETALVVLAAGLLLYAWRVDPSFVTLRAQGILATHIWELAIVAVPMLLIIVSGGIDLSVGSTLALSAVTLGLLFEKGTNPWLAALAAILVGGGLGLLNGAFVARLKVHPLIVTLATLAAYRGVAEGISLARPISDYPEGFQQLANGKVAGVPIPGLIFAILAVAAWFVLTRTVFGRWIFAIGVNEKAALFSGVPVARAKMVLYVSSGLAAGLAAAVLVARNNTAKADLAAGMELEAITAVVLGGAAIEGGVGTVLGLLLGLFLIHETREFVSWHWKQSELNLIVLGGLLIVSVLVQKGLSARGRSREAT
jgi:rhamnose transport system permease protein